MIHKPTPQNNAELHTNKKENKTNKIEITNTNRTKVQLTKSVQ